MTPFGIRKKLKSLLGLGGDAKAPSKPEIPRYTVAFVLPDGTSYEAQGKQGDTLVLVSGRGPSPIATGCADCSCATCQVEVLEGADKLSPEGPTEKRTKEANAVPDRRRLGCQAEVMGPGVKVQILNVFGEEAYDA